MKSCAIALVIVSALLFLSGCSQPASETASNAPTANSAAKAPATPDEFSVARANYAKHCSACHGDEGNGGLVEVENTKLKVPSLKEGHALEHPDEKLVKQIMKGGDGMPKFEDKFSPKEIAAMVRFIRQEFQGK